MSKLVTIVVFMFMVFASTAQNVSKNKVDSLIRSLNSGEDDHDRMDILFQLSEHYILKPGELQVDLDSAKDYLDQATALDNKMRSAESNGILALLRSLFAREKGQLKEARQLVETAVATLKNGKDYHYLGRAYFILSDYYNYNNPNESTEKIRLVELAVKAFQQSGDTRQQAFTLTFLADLYQLKDEKPRALEKLDSALALYESIGYDQLQSVYALYSTIYYGDQLFGQALKYALMALKSAQTVGDTSMTLCQVNNYIGMAFFQAKEYESAVPYYLESLKIAEKYDNSNSALILMNNIVQAYMELKKPEEALSFMKTFPEKFRQQKTDPNYVQTALSYLLIYTELKRYTEAKPYVDEILQLIKTSSLSHRVYSNLYHMISKYYLDIGQYPIAAVYIKKLDSISVSVGAVKRRANLYLKFRLDTALGNFKSAVVDLLAHKKLSDSLYNVASKKQIKELEIEYQTEKNKNEITLLNHKNLVQQNRLDKEKLMRSFIIAGIALLIIIIGLLYRQYRLKQHSNKVILQKNEQLQRFLTEKEWLVKEIHHRVKNNFHIVASLLEIQSSYLKNKEALSAIKQSQNRIHSMSIIHQKLYQSETLSTIHMPEYIYELVEYLRESYGIRESVIFTLDIENMELNHAVAITMGLILNEAITNSIKYAFADTGEGKISISLTHISDSQILLSITDNGRGLPADFKNKIGTSMGMELLQGLAGDIGGSLSIETKEGTHIRIIFSDIHNIHKQDTPFRS